MLLESFNIVLDAFIHYSLIHKTNGIMVGWKTLGSDVTLYLLSIKHQIYTRRCL